MTREEITRVLDGLVFVGSAGADGGVQGTLAERCGREVERMRERLARHDRELSSLLALDVYHEAGGDAPAAIEAALADALPGDCRPCLMFVEVSEGALGGRALATQAVSAAEPVRANGDRFSASAEAGPIVAVAAQTAPRAGDMVGQTHAVMRAVGERLAEHGAGYDDVVRFNVFYLGEGSKEDWAINARVRAGYFTEPGPATTGIPVAAIEQGALIRVRALAVREARALGLREHSWPEGHWDWPFHLPYKHGCACGGTAFVGGQVSLTEQAEVIDPGDLDRQTRRSLANILRVIDPLGKHAGDLLRLVAFYQHLDDSSPRTVERALRDDLDGRDIELTLVGLPHLAYPEMIVEIEAEAR